MVLLTRVEEHNLFQVAGEVIRSTLQHLPQDAMRAPHLLYLPIGWRVLEILCDLIQIDHIRSLQPARV